MSRRGSVDRRGRRWLAVLLSVVVHAGLVAALVWGWWTFRTAPRAPQQLAIEATVVLERSATVTPAAAPAPAPAPSPAVAPAPPVARPEPHAQDRKQAVEQAQRVREQQQAAAAAARLKEQEAAAASAAASASAAAERAASEQAQRVARDKARRESELRAQLATEERVNAARGSAEAAAWLALIRDRVTGAWIRPPSARAGVNCEVHVTQVPGGVVTGVQIGNCNGDAAVRESIEAAVYRASPLPAPSNPDLFDRSLKFNFHPDE